MLVGDRFDPAHAGVLPAPKAPPATPRGRRTRAALLTASRKVFDRDGYVNARVADITREAGVAQGSFYNYFTSKEDVFRALMAELNQHVLAVTGHGSEDQSTVERVRVTIEQFVREYRLAAGAYAALDQAAAVEDGFRAITTRNRMVFVYRVERGIKRLQRSREADPHLDPHIAGGALVAMVHNYVHTLWSHGEELDEQTVVDTLTTIWARGIGVSSPTRREGG